MGKKSRDKGQAAEREIVHYLQDKGIPARRVPLSGAQDGYPDDVEIADTWRVESKRSAKPISKKLEDALNQGTAHMVWTRCDRGTWRVYMSAEVFAGILNAALDKTVAGTNTIYRPDGVEHCPPLAENGNEST